MLCQNSQQQNAKGKLLTVPYTAEFSPILCYFLPTLHLNISTSPHKMDRKEK